MSQERCPRQEALQGIRNGSADFCRLPEELRDDAEIALAAIHKYPNERRIKSAVSGYLRSNREFVLAAVEVTGCFLQDASRELRGEREVVLVAVRNDGEALCSASLELRGDRELVLAVVRQHGRALRFASDDLRGDREIVLTAIRQDSIALEDASLELRCDREIVLEAVQQDWRALRGASRQLRGDREVVLEAVRRHGRALMFASEEMRADREVVLEAVRQDGRALWHASRELLADRAIVLMAVRRHGGALSSVSRELRADREVVLEAVRQNGQSLAYASRELCGDREIVLVALGSTEQVEDVDRDIVRYVPGNLQNDPVVARSIIRRGGHLRRGSELMERLGIVLSAVQALPEALINIVDEESVVELSRRWEHSTWHKIWMVLQLEPSAHIDGIGQLFVEMSGLPADLEQAKELRHCTPVIGAVLSLPRDWSDINNYPVQDD